jgi:hypothetical protein
MGNVDNLIVNNDGVNMEERKQPHKLDGKIALVTGAAMGNGFGGAKGLAKNGAKVYLGDISPSVHEAAAQLRSYGYAVESIIFDVCDCIVTKNAVAEIIKKEGRIDILFNNAGVVKLYPFLEMSDEDRDFHFDVNIKGIWNTAKAVYPYMIKQQYGKIVNMSSVTGPMVVDMGETAYATTKAAVLGFTKALAYEAAPYNINVNAICPGYILTPMAQQIAKESNPKDPDASLKAIASAVPLQRLGTIEEIGDLVSFLSSDEASYLVGTQIVIDGGSTLPETFGAVGV